ncbi:MAG: hypothetical protein A3E01_18840 [Gammaproteobacteria bacterium RIFCSPHIGHO2_12_FULL_63_22]|nr:MAG: hypothetical protein A3E01_18840 [Gammaproteobacteria bacterium RIFCSPHIGHO2_12_FULL_63_22]
MALAGCSKPETPAPESVVVHAGPCSIVLTNPKVGRNLKVDNHCTVPEERAIVEDLFTLPFAQNCGYYYPKLWHVVEGSPEFSLHIEPPRGNYFSKYHFGFEASPRSTSWYEELFLNATSDDVDYEQHVKPMGVSKETFAQLKALREAHPGSFFTPDFMARVNQSPNEPTSETLLGTLPVRTILQYEDGTETEAGDVPIYRDEEGGLHVAVVIFPEIQAYPDLSSEYRTRGDSFTCTADAGMDKAVFSDLCAGLIERTTLSDNYDQKSACFDREE